MNTASRNLVAGRPNSAAPGGFFPAIHLVPATQTPDQSPPHAKRQALSNALFTLARLAPAMLWLGNFGRNR